MWSEVGKSEEVQEMRWRGHYVRVHTGLILILGALQMFDRHLIIPILRRNTEY